VNWLTASVQEHGAWVNTSNCGMPIYWADPDTPRVTVALNHPAYMDPAMIRAWSSVPIPAGAAPANCGDKNFAVLQRQPDGRVFGWEFWSATKLADGSWVAKWGGANSDVMADRGIASSVAWNDPSAPNAQSRSSAWSWNVTATSVSMMAGVITLGDLERGSIDHAVSMATFDAAMGKWLWPAQRTDGNSIDPAAIPEGAHLRLDPTLDVEALPVTPLVKMIARAAQKYGIVVRDRTLWNTVFYVQTPPPGYGNPLTALLGGKMLDKAMLTFPWSRLQVLDAPTCSGGFECEATPEAVIDVATTAPTAGSPVTLDTSRSVLNHPRALVEWDFDGDGTYEAERGTGVSTRFTPTSGGARTVGVRITTRDGEVATGSKRVDVKADTPAVTATPVTVRPASVQPTYFYPYSSTYTALSSVNATTSSPALPTSSRKLYTSKPTGTATITFGPAGAPATASVVYAYVECTSTRCLTLTVSNSAGAVLGQKDVPFGTRGWISIGLTGNATGLAMRVAARNALAASGNASISAVHATVTTTG
jgi:hypothetical protein